MPSRFCNGLLSLPGEMAREMAREWTLLKNPRNCLERQVILKGEWWKFVSQRPRKRQYSICQTATTGKTLYDLPHCNQLRRRLLVRWVSSQTTENLLACHKNHDYRGNWTFHRLTCITSGTIRTSASEYKIPLTNWRQFFLRVCPVIEHEFRHHIVKEAVDPRGDSRVDLRMPPSFLASRGFAARRSTLSRARG